MGAGVLGARTLLFAASAPRSSSAIALTTILYYLLIWMGGFQGRIRHRLRLRHLFVVSASLLVGLSMAYGLYTWAAPKGYLGELQEKKFEGQANMSRFGNTPWGLILTGRHSVYAAVLGVLDRPFLGVGAWSGGETFDYYIEAVYDLGFDVDADSLAAQLDSNSFGAAVSGAGHSVIFGEWLEQGIGAAVFWIAAWVMYAKLFLYFFRKPSMLTPLLGASFLGFTWGWLFSPIGVSTRITIGLILAFTILLKKNSRFRQRVDEEFSLSRSWKRLLARD